MSERSIEKIIDPGQKQRIQHEVRHDGYDVDRNTVSVLWKKWIATARIADSWFVEEAVRWSR